MQDNFRCWTREQNNVSKSLCKNKVYARWWKGITAYPIVLNTMKKTKRLKRGGGAAVLFVVLIRKIEKVLLIDVTF